MTAPRSQKDVPLPLSKVPETPSITDLEPKDASYMTSLFDLLPTTIMHAFDMTQKTAVFFGIVFAMEVSRCTSTSKSCSYLVYLIGGVVNGVVMDFLESKFRVRKGSGAQFAMQIVVSLVISSGMLEFVGGGW